MKRRSRERRKAYWARQQNIGQTLIEGGDGQARVGASTLILGQIRRPFFNNNHRILKTGVPQPKTTQLIRRFCLIEKKLDIWAQ
jgi:hypothetical protein